MREQNLRIKSFPDGSGLATPLFACGLIALVAILVYGNSLLNPLYYDDEESITLNPSVKHLWPIWAPFSPPDGSNLAGRPLLNLTFALDYAICGESVWGYHATNLLIHLLAALTLFGIVRRTLLMVGTRVPSRPIKTSGGRKKHLSSFQERFSNDSFLLALAIALLWLVHPLQTESVSYISQRSESLMGLFYLLTLYCFIRSVDVGSRSWIWLTLSVGACFLGMAVKEVMITAPLMVFIYDRTFVAETFQKAWQLRWKFYVALMATWLLLGYLLLDVGNRAVGVGFGATPWTYALTQCWAIIHYLVLTVWPHPLVVDYGMTLVTDPWQIIPHALVLLILLAVTIAAYWRWPAVGFMGVWFFIILAPTSTLIPITLEPIAEHRLYLPLAALLILIVLGLYALMGRNAGWPIVALMLMWAVMTFLRNEDYGSALILWQQSVTQNPENARAHHNYGLTLLRNGQITDAIAQFQNAVSLYPQYVDAHLNWGFALAREGEYPEAIGHYQEALRLNPNYFQAQNNWGVALAQMGRYSEAITHFQEATQLNPSYADAYRNEGLALLYAGRKDEAREQFEKTLQIDPGSTIARENLDKLNAEQAAQVGK